MTTPRASQFSIISVIEAPKPPPRCSQAVLISVIANGKKYVSLGPVRKLNCWQPCTAYGFRGIVVNLNGKAQ